MFPPAGCFLRRAPTFQSFLGTAVAETGPPAPRAGAGAIKRLTQGHVFYIRRRVHAVQHSGGSCWSNWSGYNAGYLAREELAEGNGCSLGAWGGGNLPLAKLWGWDGDARYPLHLSLWLSCARDGATGQGRWVLPRCSHTRGAAAAPGPPPHAPLLSPGWEELTAEENEMSSGLKSFISRAPRNGAGGRPPALCAITHPAGSGRAIDGRRGTWRGPRAVAAASLPSASSPHPPPRCFHKSSPAPSWCFPGRSAARYTTVSVRIACTHQEIRLGTGTAGGNRVRYDSQGAENKRQGRRVPFPPPWRFLSTFPR